MPTMRGVTGETTYAQHARVQRHDPAFQALFPVALVPAPDFFQLGVGAPGPDGPDELFLDYVDEA